MAKKEPIKKESKKLLYRLDKVKGSISELQHVVKKNKIYKNNGIRSTVDKYLLENERKDKIKNCVNVECDWMRETGSTKVCKNRKIPYNDFAVNTRLSYKTTDFEKELGRKIKDYLKIAKPIEEKIHKEEVREKRVLAMKEFHLMLKLRKPSISVDTEPIEDVVPVNKYSHLKSLI